MSTCLVQEEAWFDITMWGDSLSVHLNWNWDASKLEGQCTATVNWDGVSVDAAASQKQISKVMTEVEGALVEGEEATGLNDLNVIGGSFVLKRGTVGDIVMEVPTNLATCRYDPSCGNANFHKVDFTVQNLHPTEVRTLRLTISRQFNTRYPGFTQGTRGFAEITGFSAMIWDQDTQEPIGLPHQISKNWHNQPSDYSANNNAHWWTVNILVHLPPNFSKDLSLALAYEKYRGVNAYSHSQLSTIGYSEKKAWLWEEAALGSSGENFVMDPLGEHTRAVITDVRAKLFDGTWKENVGGGDYLVFFDGSGTFRYKKELTSQIRSSGPCLSDALYTSITDDGSIKSEIQVSGGRTDDLVRVFIHVRHTALRATNFKRFAFFQMGSEGYNYNPNFQNFAYGSGQTEIDSFARTCGVTSNTQGSFTSKASGHMYDSGNSGKNKFREELTGDGPWWFAFEDNTKATAGAKKVGDKGLIVRNYEASFGGTTYSKPSFSMLCDKIELGTPLGVSSLQEGDYVDMRLEMLVMPLEQDLDGAVALSGTYNSATVNSESLEYLNTFTSARQRVMAHATPFSVTLVPGSGGTVISEYPIRISVPDGFDPSVDHIDFTVTGSAIGFVPIVISNLSSSLVPSGSGLWASPNGATNFEFKTAVTQARQANYVREGETYELVFNMEIGDFGNDAFQTEIAFGVDPGAV